MLAMLRVIAKTSMISPPFLPDGQIYPLLKNYHISAMLLKSCLHDFVA